MLRDLRVERGQSGPNWDMNPGLSRSLVKKDRAGRGPRIVGQKKQFQGMLLPFDSPRTTFEKPSRGPILVHHLKIGRARTLRVGLVHGHGDKPKRRLFELLQSQLPV